MQVLDIETPTIRSEFYTDLDEAVHLLNERRSDAELRQTLLASLNLPSELTCLSEVPHLVHFRQVATPTHEIGRVLKVAELFGLKPIIFELKDDKFVGAKNVFKRNLGKLPIFTGKDHQNNTLFKYRTIVDFTKNDGLPIYRVKTVRNESLIDLHHELCNTIFKKEINSITIDVSHWISQFGSRAEEFYKSFFQLFISEAVLADVFFLSGSESELTTNVIHPALEDIIKKTGMKPLIWNPLPNKEEGNVFWDCYPSEVDEFLLRRGYS